MKNKNGSKKSASPSKSKIGAGTKKAQTKNTGNSLNNAGNNVSSTALIQEQERPAQITKVQEQALINKKKKSTSQAEASDAK
jgi:hypothetical protein